MKAVLLVLFVFFLAVLNATGNNTVYIEPSTKVYVEDMQWQRIDSELRDYLKFLALNGEQSQSEQAKEALAEIRYSSYTIIMSGQILKVWTVNDRIYAIGPADELQNTIHSFLGSSCIYITQFEHGIEVRWNVIDDSTDNMDVSFSYSAVDGASWLLPHEEKMHEHYNPVKQIRSFSYLIEDNDDQNIEFVFRVYRDGYDYWLNNQGRNYSIYKGF